MLRLLLKKEADINAIDEYGSALQRAPCCDCEMMVELPLKKGTDVDTNNRIHEAVLAQDV